LRPCDALRRQLRDFAPRELVVPGGKVAWPNGVEPVPDVPKGVKRRPYDGVDSPAAFARLNRLIARGPFHVMLSKVYPLDATARALRDVQRHHVGKLAIEIGRGSVRSRKRGRPVRAR
jgi:NADPH:quinone reductase-like Zn-dependent oxidoreductase